MRFNKILSNARAATLLFVALSLAIPAFAQTDIADKLSQVRVKNFGRINDHYYRGGQPQGRDYADLAQLGVKTVINLIGDNISPDEKRMVENAGMKYHHLPMTTHVPPTPAELTEFLKIVNDPDSQPVYVHCVGGRHRTGVMTAAYRMTKDGWTADQAYKEMKRFDFGPSFFHPEFKSFVYDYYDSLIRTAPEPTVVGAGAASQ